MFGFRLHEKAVVNSGKEARHFRRLRTPPPDTPDVFESQASRRIDPSPFFASIDTRVGGPGGSRETLRIEVMHGQAMAFPQSIRYGYAVQIARRAHDQNALIHEKRTD